jgi:hypothetical protein
MHPKRMSEIEGCRLAFAQGGEAGMKLVYLSPPVHLVAHRNVTEARWQPSMPFRYEQAPLLVNMGGETDFPALKKLIEGVRRSTWISKFSSKYRSSRTPLASDVAREVVRKFDRTYSRTNHGLAHAYDEALPYSPRKIDKNRSETYRSLLAEAKR